MNPPHGLTRIIDVYFREAFVKRFSRGEILLEQGEPNDRVYWIESGELAGIAQDLAQNEDITLFTLSRGMFFGVHSFFAQTGVASNTIVAQSDGCVRWIDRQTQAQDTEQYGSLTEQFVPVMVHELARRQRQTERQAQEKQKALAMASANEHMATLGQLAAGLAHELNNAVTVLDHKTQKLESAVVSHLSGDRKHAFDLGRASGQALSSKAVRERAKTLVKMHKLPLSAAKRLAKMSPEGEIPPEWLNNLSQWLDDWTLGRDCHDIDVAAKHATEIVRSVKQLGGGDPTPSCALDVQETLQKALTLLSRELREVELVLNLQENFALHTSETHLVQVWINLIKNACEAMQQTVSPRLRITVLVTEQDYQVHLENNGPAIPYAIRQKIFQPDFTTKKGGMSFGLGLGLSIVKRIVQQTGGEIRVFGEETTVFVLKWAKNQEDLWH